MLVARYARPSGHVPARGHHRHAPPERVTGGRPRVWPPSSRVSAGVYRDRTVDLLRRGYPWGARLRRGQAAQRDASPVLEAGDFRVDLENRRVSVKGAEVHLTPKEYDLMVYLVSHPGKVLTHRTLLTSIWGGDSAEQTEYLRVFVGQLRKKVEPDTAAPQYILTEPWIGYRFDPGS